MLKLDLPLAYKPGAGQQALKGSPALTTSISPPKPLTLTSFPLARLTAQLQDSEARYQVLFEAMDEGFCIIELVQCKVTGLQDFVYIEANPACIRQSGMSDMVGKTLRQVIPDECEEWIAIYANVIESGQSTRFERGLVGQGRVLELHAFCVGDARLSRLAVSFHDITERMQAQETLRQSEARFRVLFNRGPVGIYSVNASGIVQEFNEVAAQFWGREPKRGDANELFCGAFKLYLPDGTPMPHALTPVAKVIHGELQEARDVEVIMERPDGSRITVVVNIAALRDAQGKIIGAINCFFDITERKRLERETQLQALALEDQDRSKNEFLAMLGHELRNPLAPIMNAVHILGLDASAAPPQRKALQIIDRQVRQLKLLVDDLLEVSRITTGLVQLQSKSITLRSVVDHALETLQPMAAKRQHEVIVSLPSEDIWLYADAARLEQVLVNLLTNASKYSEVEGQIWVTAHSEEDTVVLSVRDMGIGIAPDLLPHVFDLFIQAKRSLDRSQGGLGIGLCLVKRLVELHGGTVHARSTPGQGSVFTVRLPTLILLTSSAPLTPLTSVAPLPAALVSMEMPMPMPVSIRRRVLVVDDNIDAADSLKDLLEMAGHDVRVASDGYQALAAAESFCPELMLLDIGLPGLTGLEVARRLRQQPAFGKTLLVAMTGYGHPLDRERTVAAGFDHHLVKPTDFDSVQAILDSMAR